MIIYAYNLDADVLAAPLEADKLVVVARRLVPAKPLSAFGHRNKFPATELFHNVKPYFNATQTTATLADITTGKTVAYIEKGDDDGVNWRYYNNADKTKADQCILLVYGDARRDVMSFNPGVEVSKVNDKTILIRNVSLINGQLWKHAPMNDDLQNKGCMWTIHNVSDRDSSTTQWIANGNVFDTNRGSSRLEFVKLSIDPNAPATTDFEGNTHESDDTADYIWTTSDQADNNEEYLKLIYFYDVKGVFSPLVLPFTKLFTVLS